MTDYKPGDQVLYDDNPGTVLGKIPGSDPVSYRVQWHNVEAVSEVWGSDLEPASTSAHDLAAVARPGDTIILAFNRALADDEISELEQSFGYLKARGIEVAFSDQVLSMVVVRPEVSDATDEG